MTKITIESFLARVSDNAKKSEKTYALENGTVLPMYVIEEARSEFGINRVNYYAFCPESGDYDYNTLIDEYARFALFLIHEQPRQMRKLLNDGELYDYITNSVGRAKELVKTQTEHWAEKDRECKLAKLNGDAETYNKLWRNLRLIAEDEIFKTVLYRV